MQLSSLNVDVLLYLMKFIDPEDRFNLVLSGILKRFENVNISLISEGIDLRQRIEDVGIELGLRRDGTCQLEIRSLNDGSMNCYLEDKSRLNTLEWLVDRGYFQNNRQMIVNSWWQSIRFLRFILSMNNLAKLSLLHWTLILTQAVPQLFRSCPKLTELHLRLLESQELEMNEDLKNELRTGFQKIRLCELICKIGSWQIMQEMFTWLKDCVHLTVRNCTDNQSTLVTDGSLTLNPDFAQNLRFLHLQRLPAGFVKWILPFCPNIHTLRLFLIDHIWTHEGMYPEEIIRNCRQVEVLRVDATKFCLGNLADLEDNENIKDVHLHWVEGPSANEVLPILKKMHTFAPINFKEWDKAPFSVIRRAL